MRWGSGDVAIAFSPWLDLTSSLPSFRKSNPAINALRDVSLAQIEAAKLAGFFRQAHEAKEDERRTMNEGKVAA